MRSLGSGSYGQVYRVRMVNLRQNQDAALKVFDTGKGEEADEMEYYTERGVLHEIAAMEKGFDIKLQIAHWRDDIGGVECPKLMLEYIPGIDMEHISLKTLSFPSLITFVLSMMKQIENVLNNLHFFNIYHNDIKPANIIYDSRKRLFFLIDFGLAIPLSLLHKSEFQGLNFWTTIGYMSPYHFDLIDRRGEELSDDEKTRWKAEFADLYSLGLTAINIIGAKCTNEHSDYSLCQMAMNILETQKKFTAEDESQYPQWTMERIRSRMLPFWRVIQDEIMTEARKPISEIENAPEFLSLLT